MLLLLLHSEAAGGVRKSLYADRLGRAPHRDRAADDEGERVASARGRDHAHEVAGGDAGSAPVGVVCVELDAFEARDAQLQDPARHVHDEQAAVQALDDARKLVVLADEVRQRRRSA